MVSPRDDARRWLDAYARAWEQADDVRAADLFAVDAVYRSHPFRQPHEGRDAIRDYWRRATTQQEDVKVRLGEPLADGARVAAEWWATMRDADDGHITLPGVFVLRFAADGRCEELREYWAEDNRLAEPYEGWGRLGHPEGVDIRAAVARWAGRYEEGWRALDVDRIVQSYGEDVIYRSHPFREPHRGREGVRAYTAPEFGQEGEVEPRFGTPVVEGDAAAVEYWATMREAGRPVTLAGCVILRFGPDGLPGETREYWHLDPGTFSPTPRWGA